MNTLSISVRMWVETRYCDVLYWNLLTTFHTLLPSALQSLVIFSLSHFLRTSGREWQSLPYWTGRACVSEGPAVLTLLHCNLNNWVSFCAIRTGIAVGLRNSELVGSWVGGLRESLGLRYSELVGSWVRPALSSAPLPLLFPILYEMVCTWSSSLPASKSCD